MDLVHQPTWMNKQKTALIAAWILLFITILIGIFLLTDPDREVLSAAVYSQQGSPQLGSFDPSLTPSTTPTPGVGSITPTPSGGAATPAVTMPPIAAGKVTQQVDWVYGNVGRCWSAWSGDQCSYTPHEGGGDLVSRDLDGDGTPDITCSLGTGVRRKTTITNTSSKSFEVRCERYHCAACKSANGTYAQCDGGLDEGVLRSEQKIMLTPGCSLTCSWSGVEGSCQSAPTPTPGVGSPTPTSGAGNPTVGICSEGPAPYCNVTNLLTYFGGDDIKAKNASQICSKESGGNPLAKNTSCTNSGGTLDYSIGLYQINLLAHCSSDLLKRFSSENYSGADFNARSVFAYSGNSPTMPCKILDQTKLSMCERAMLDPVRNIQKTVSLSSNGTNWRPWAAARVCKIQ